MCRENSHPILCFNIQTDWGSSSHQSSVRIVGVFPWGTNGHGKCEDLQCGKKPPVRMFGGGGPKHMGNLGFSLPVTVFENCRCYIHALSSDGLLRVTCYWLNAYWRVNKANVSSHGKYSKITGACSSRSGTQEVGCLSYHARVVFSFFNLPTQWSLEPVIALLIRRRIQAFTWKENWRFLPKASYILTVTTFCWILAVIMHGILQNLCCGCQNSVCVVIFARFAVIKTLGDYLEFVSWQYFHMYWGKPV